jgi:hypothetical protein
MREMGFGVQSTPSVVAAGVLICIGVLGMRQPLSPSQGQFLSAATASDLAAVDAALHQRETTLHQRREAEELLGQFIRGQMTRHYWGHFATSLTDLGILSSDQLQARVISSPEGSELWLTPKRGKEAYAAAVRQQGPLLARWQCRGPVPATGEEVSITTGCPQGWHTIAHNQN